MADARHLGCLVTGAGLDEVAHRLGKRFWVDFSDNLQTVVEVGAFKVHA